MAISSPNVQQGGGQNAGGMFLDTMKTVNSMFAQMQQLRQNERALQLTDQAQKAKSMFSMIEKLAPDFGGYGVLAKVHPEIYQQAFEVMGMPKAESAAMMKAFQDIPLSAQKQGDAILQFHVQGGAQAASRAAVSANPQEIEGVFSGYAQQAAETLMGQLDELMTLMSGQNLINGNVVEVEGDGVVPEAPAAPVVTEGEGDVVDTGVTDASADTGTSSVDIPEGSNLTATQVRALEAKKSVGYSLTAEEEKDLEAYHERATYDRDLELVVRRLEAYPRIKEVYEKSLQSPETPTLRPSEIDVEVARKVYEENLRRYKELTGKEYQGTEVDAGAQEEPPASQAATDYADYARVRQQEQEKRLERERNEAEGRLGTVRETSMAPGEIPTGSSPVERLRGMIASSGATDARQDVGPVSAAANQFAVGRPTEGSEYVGEMNRNVRTGGPQQAPVQGARGPGRELPVEGKTEPGMTRYPRIAELPEGRERDFTRAQTGTGSQFSSRGEELLSPAGRAFLRGENLPGPKVDTEHIDRLNISKEAKDYMVSHDAETAAFARVQQELQDGLPTVQARSRVSPEEITTRFVGDVRDAVKRGKESPAMLKAAEYTERFVGAVRKSGEQIVDAFQRLPRQQQEQVERVVVYDTKKHVADLKEELRGTVEYINDAPREVVAQFVPGVEASSLKSVAADIERRQMNLAEEQFRSNETLKALGLLFQTSALKLQLQSPEEDGPPAFTDEQEKFVDAYFKTWDTYQTEEGSGANTADFEKMIKGNTAAITGMNLVKAYADAYGMDFKKVSVNRSVIEWLTGASKLVYEAVQPWNFEASGLNTFTGGQ